MSNECDTWYRLLRFQRTHHGLICHVLVHACDLPDQITAVMLQHAGLIHFDHDHHDPMTHGLGGCWVGSVMTYLIVPQQACCIAVHVTGT